MDQYNSVVTTFGFSDGLTSMYDDRRERQTLILLFQSTNGAAWNDTSKWNSNASISDWYHVTCRDRHVVKVALEDNGLSGFFPPIFGLTHLRELSFAGNDLTGPVPWQLLVTAIPTLKTLDLSRNKFTGPVDWDIIFNTLDGLQFFNICNNQFEGEHFNFVLNLLVFKNKRPN